jgi:hypothetical protein
MTQATSSMRLTRRVNRGIVLLSEVLMREFSCSMPLSIRGGDIRFVFYRLCSFLPPFQGAKRDKAFQPEDLFVPARQAESASPVCVLGAGSGKKSQ